MYESSPATNGILAEPPSQADPIPAMDRLSKKANGAIIQITPIRFAIKLTACTIPCNTLMSDFCTATSNVNVAPMYNSPERTPPNATAPGRAFSGSWISSPMTDASSKPTSPKQITPNEFSTNLEFARIWKSAQVIVDPNRVNVTIPSPTSNPAATKVPIPPALLIHFPTPNPTTFNTTSTPNKTTDTPTKYSMTVGTYIILFVQ